MIFEALFDRWTPSPAHSPAPCRPSPSPSRPAGMGAAPEDRLRQTTPPQPWLRALFVPPPPLFYRSAEAAVVRVGHPARRLKALGGNFGSSPLSGTSCPSSSGGSAALVCLHQAWWWLWWARHCWINLSETEKESGSRFVSLFFVKRHLK